LRLGRIQLWTPTTSQTEFPAIFIVVAATSEGIHVVQSPDHWQAWRKLAKKIAVVKKSSDPVKIQNICLWQLAQYVRAVLVSIITEVSRARASSLYFAPSPFQLPPFQPPAKAGRNVARRRKLQNGGVGRRFVLRKQPRLLTKRTQTFMQPIGRPSGTACEIVSTEVGDPHVRVASMKSESGL
jgi:hypothetical protein